MTRCKARIYRDIWDPRGQCSRKAMKDGFCRQHHPDAVEERRKKQKERYEKEAAAFKDQIRGKSYRIAFERIAAGEKNPVKIAKEALK